MCWCGLELCRPSLGILLKDCRVENGRRTKKPKTPQLPCQGTRGLAPMWHSLPKLGACTVSPVGGGSGGLCGVEMWELALGGGSHAAGYP